MELTKLRALILILVVFVDQSNASLTNFKDCYSKCFVFCLIEPSQNLCTCTSRCLKECIFNSGSDNSSSTSTVTASSNNDVRLQPDSKNLNFCKLGCAFSTCSTLSSKHQPNGGKMDDCVGSCSRMCTRNYSSP
uniref:Thionin-like protein 2 n=2 Tax=Nicotiana TaxID=4085 RepID=A0A1S4BJV3_TOBAC|nr:PREDICTED: thionin-like protein 2 [Nicotiana sylvestris]XP_016489072.1 PREDICTED: thionin-like protein 2 [Nicotiana tabacum]